MNVDKNIDRIDDTLTKLLTDDNVIGLDDLLKVMEHQLDEAHGTVTDVWFDWAWRAMVYEERTGNLYMAGLNVILPIFKPIVKGLEILLNFILVPLLLLFETGKLWHEHIDNKFEERQDKITELRKVIRDERKSIELEGEKP